MISTKIKQIRIENHLTQKELAEKLNVSNKTISHWEAGYTEPPIQVLVLLKKTFNLDYEDLLED